MSISDNLQLALTYHGLGWSVIPLKPGSKEPHPELLPKKTEFPELFPDLTHEEGEKRTWKPYQSQRASEEQVREWWTKDPQAGIGLVLGQVSGVVALDFDGGGAEQLAKDNGVTIPPMTCTRTGGGGVHYLFRCAEALATTTTLLKGDDCHVELRAEGSYVVLPGSIHPSGNRYEELIPPEEIVDLPDHIRKLAQSRARTDSHDLDSSTDRLPERFVKLLASDRKLKELFEEPCPDGDQSARDYALACRCLEKGLTKTEAATALWLMPHGKRHRDKRKPDYVQATVARAANAVKARAKKPKQAELLVRIAERSCTQLFTDQTDQPFAQLPLGNHQEIWPVNGRPFKRWLSVKFRSQEGKPPSNNAVSEAVLSIEGACTEGGRHQLHNRVGWHDGVLYYDLADRDWRAVKITRDGWKIVADPPTLFRRYAHQQAQVAPARDGNIEPLLDFLNVRNDALLILVYVVSCFIPDIPHPILVVDGPQGSAKSSACRALRMVVDPSVTPVLSFPREHTEAVQQLQHNWVCLYDNISNLPLWLSDLLCRASTGEGFAKRELYSDEGDVIFQYKRCCGVNGIAVQAGKRPDFLDRSVILRLDRIPDENRRTEAELNATFNHQLPIILGACFDALCCAIKTYPTISLPRLPRMADFGRWGACIAEGLGYTARGFLNGYQSHIAELDELALEAQPFAQVCIQLMDQFGGWRGTASDLLKEGNAVASEQGINTGSKAWPATPVWAKRRLEEA